MRSTKPPRGYHKNCGGAVSLQRSKTYAYPKCSRCGMTVVATDLMPQGFRVLHQKTSGRKRHRPKYDIESWKDVKL